jgi:hypothetical protein
VSAKLLTEFTTFAASLATVEIWAGEGFDASALTAPASESTEDLIEPDSLGKSLLAELTSAVASLWILLSWFCKPLIPLLGFKLLSPLTGSSSQSSKPHRSSPSGIARVLASPRSDDDPPSARRDRARYAMTARADFTDEEWKLVLEGPPSAGMIVITAGRGGTIRETFAIGKAYAEARKQHGESELLDEIVAAKPEIDHTRYSSPEELKQHGLQHLRDAIALLERKATPQEVEDYRRFVLGLADKVAGAHREGGVAVSEPESLAIGEISASLAGSTP